MKLPSLPAVAAIIGITIILLAGVVGIIIVVQQGPPGDRTVKVLVTEAVTTDLSELKPANVRLIWRNTDDPNEIVVAGMFDALSDDEYYFTALVLKYNTGWAVGHIREDTTKTYRFLTRKSNKKK